MMFTGEILDIIILEDGGFKHFLVSPPKLGEMIHFEHFWTILFTSGVELSDEIDVTRAPWDVEDSYPSRKDLYNSSIFVSTLHFSMLLYLELLGT